MIQKTALIVTETVLFALQTAAQQIVNVKNYPYALWKVATGMAWTFVVIDVVDALIQKVAAHLRKVRTTIAYRMYYVEVTQPMAEAYRDLRRAYRSPSHIR
jgi:hypothetical protein